MVIPLNVHHNITYFHRQAKKSSTNFHHTRQREQCTAECVVHTFEGHTNHDSFSTIYIPGSHRHANFFEAFRLHLCNRELLAVDILRSSNTTWFASFCLTDLNLVCQKVRNGFSPSPVYQSLTPEERNALPEQFVIRQLPMNCAWVAIFDSGLLRASSTMGGAVTRWKIHYRIESGDALAASLGDWPKSEQPRAYELKQSSLKSPWPQSFALPTAEAGLDLSEGVTLYELHGPTIEPYFTSAATFLRTLMQWPEDRPFTAAARKELTHWHRNPRQFQSLHIPQCHGRTMYGHTLPELADLLAIILPAVSSTLAAMWPDCKRATATTADIAVQF